MVATQHKPVIGSVEYVERPVSPELQEALTREDAALPAELRERFPVVAWDEIKARFPDHWIALLPTHVDDQDRLIAGRLIALAKDHQEFQRSLESIRLANPHLPVFTHYTGQYPMGENAITVTGMFLGTIPACDERRSG